MAGVLRGDGPGEPAGSPRRKCLPGAPGARKRVHLERHFTVCNATSGLTTPVNRLLKGPEVYSRALSSVVNGIFVFVGVGGGGSQLAGVLCAGVVCYAGSVFTGSSGLWVCGAGVCVLTRRFVPSREGSYVLVGDSYRLATVRTVGVRSVVRSAEALVPSAEPSREVPNRHAKCRTVRRSAEPSSGARGRTRQARTPSAHACARGPVKWGTKTAAARRQWQQSRSSAQMTPTASANQRKPAPPTDNGLANPATTTRTAAPTPTTTPTNRKCRKTTPSCQ